VPKPESVFVPPEDENAIIWRYMDFPKFVSFLASKSLYFSRSDLLGDPFEGSYPIVNKEIRGQIADELIAKISNNKLLHDWGETFINSRSASNKFIAKNMFVNCWHINEIESFAMWNIYAKDSKGIAVQSTYKLLRESLPKNIFIGKVNYINYKLQPLKEIDLFSPIIHKRKSFEHEKELRAVKFMLAKSKLDPNGRVLEPEMKGVLIPVDINKSITRIYIAPSSEDWFYDVVMNVSKKFELVVPLERSPLDDAPFF
jgi:hypothetical protein